MEEVTICIPARNEESVILPTIDTLLAVCDAFPTFAWRIVVVDNASTDDTASFVLGHSDSRVDLLRQPVLGKGAAVTHAAQMCQSEYFVYIDADLSADPYQIPVLLEKIRSNIDIAIGSRLLNTAIVQRSFWRTLISKMFNAYAEFLVPVSVADSQCPLKVMNKKGREILASCVDTGWFFDREFLAKANKRRLGIIEVPIFWEEFRYPDRKSKLRVLRAGLESIVRLWYIRSEIKKF